LKDEVPKRRCKVENVRKFIKILWFETECPNRYSNYTDASKLREIFI